MQITERTTITISRETKEALSSRGTVKDSYEDVLRKLLGLPVGGTQ